MIVLLRSRRCSRRESGIFKFLDGERREQLDRLPARLELGFPGFGRKGSGVQASKGIRWMPWHQEAMKDVAKLRKATGSRKQATIRGYPNRETGVVTDHAASG